jgi:hypothetical protein
METTVHNLDSTAIAEVLGTGPLIHSVQDALDLLAGVQYERGAKAVILHKAHLPAEFFDLRSGMAGEILQKVSNYHFRLAIVGDFGAIESSALRDFIRESNRTGQVLFQPDVSSALAAFEAQR